MHSGDFVTMNTKNAQTNTKRTLNNTKKHGTSKPATGQNFRQKTVGA